MGEGWGEGGYLALESPPAGKRFSALIVSSCQVWMREEAMGSASTPAGCRTCSVRSSCILSALLQEDRAKLSRKLCRLRLEPRNTIFRQGVPVAGLYLLCRGHAKLEFRAPRGKKLLVRFCGPGDLLAGAFSEGHAMSAVALDPVVVTLLPKELARGLFERRPELAMEVARRLSREWYTLLGRLACFAYGSVRARLARGLLELGTRYGVRCEQGLLIDLPLSQHDLADLIGASRQKVNLNLREFINQGLIRTERGRITILDQNGLQELG